MGKKNILLGIGLLIAGIAAGVALTVKMNAFSPAQSEAVKQEPPVSLEGYRMEDAVINVAKTTGKAVVSISTEHTQKVKGGKQFYFNGPFGGSPFGGDQNFRKFFDDFLGQMPDREYKQTGLGTGVIIDQAGYILTNEHVINDADKISVTLPDGRNFKGEVKGRDIRSDLAVIKINAKNLPVATLGDSDSIQIGEWVVAIGNPFGFAMQNPEPTVTVGVISALHRTLGKITTADRDYNDLVQTDAAINPGNSGGPLVNLKGEVIGVNVAIFSTSGGYQGVGFAIPINSAKRVISRLIEGKKILYGWLGITVQDMSEDMAKYFGLTDKSGVLVAKALDNGPAQKAGIKESDVLKSFDGKVVNSVRDLLSAVAKTEVGRKVKVVLIREKKELSLEVEVGQRPDNLDGAGAQTEAPVAVGAWRGISVAELGAEKTGNFKTEEKSGVMVVDLQPDSLAEQAGIIPGDVILEINKRTITNIADYDKATKEFAKGDCMVRTSRGFFLIKGEE